jgi:hypothetical protein
MRTRAIFLSLDPDAERPLRGDRADLRHEERVAYPEPDLVVVLEAVVALLRDRVVVEPVPRADVMKRDARPPKLCATMITPGVRR